MPVKVRTGLNVIFLVLSASLIGCAAPSNVAIRPVENRIPPLAPGVWDRRRVDLPPVVASMGHPSYPPELLASGIYGTAVVSFTVRVDGAVTDALIVKADDIHFGEAAVQAILKWRFHPASVGGAPVACRTTEIFYFRSPYERNGVIVNRDWPIEPFSAHFYSGGNR
jgi:TonB family protein